MIDVLMQDIRETAIFFSAGFYQFCRIFQKDFFLVALYIKFCDYFNHCYSQSFQVRFFIRPVFLFLLYYIRYHDHNQVIYIFL